MWSQIKRQKGANDAKRGAVFTKIAREIAIAARSGGGDPDANYRLRLAVDKARSVNMPADNIKRAIERASGGDKAEQFEEIVYEGYGPGGVAILVEAATDNRNRTAADVRAIFTKAGGTLAGSGAVAWQFEQLGLIACPGGGRRRRGSAGGDRRGRERRGHRADPIEVSTDASDLETVRKGLEAAGIRVESAELTMQPKSTVEVEGNHVRQNLRLVETLEDHDDVQRVTANFDIPDDVLAEAMA